VSAAVVSILGAQLGNQMFQYAAGRALAEARGSELLLYLPEGVDDSLLASFPLMARRWEPSDHAIHPYLARMLQSSRTTRVLKRAERMRPLSARRWYENGGFNHDPNFSRLGGNLVLNGYWQSYKYFGGIRELLRVELRCRLSLSLQAQDAMRKIASHPQPVAIHVRRGDYVDGGWPVLSSAYYESALTVLREQHGVDAPGLFVFSNDPAWCETELLPGRPRTVVSSAGTTAVDDLALMSACQYILISPSTFSWWAAYLSNRARAVLAPFRWFFHDYEGFRHDDIYPPDWIIVRD